MYEFTFDNKVKIGIFKELDIDFSRSCFDIKIFILIKNKIKKKESYSLACKWINLK